MVAQTFLFSFGFHLSKQLDLLQGFGETKYGKRGKNRNPHKLLPFKRSVTMSLLAHGLNFEKQGAERIGRLAHKIHPSGKKNKRRKSKFPEYDRTATTA